MLFSDGSQRRLISSRNLYSVKCGRDGILIHVSTALNATDVTKPTMDMINSSITALNALAGKISPKVNGATDLNELKQTQDVVNNTVTQTTNTSEIRG